MKPTQIKEYIRESYHLNALTIDGQRFSAITTALPITILLNHFKVDGSFGTKTDSGYQRKLGNKRVKELSRRIIDDDVLLPLNFTVNIRNSLAFAEIKNNKFTYVPNVHGKLFIVDGQHRTLGLEMAFKEAIEMINKGELEGTEIINVLEKKKVPVLITFTEDVVKEIEFFQEINGKQKGVALDDTFLNHYKRIKGGDTRLRDQLINEDLLERMFTNTDRLERINKDSNSVWYNRIKFPGLKSLSPSVGISAMTTYIGEINKVQILEAQNISVDKKIEFFNAYWLGLEMAYPTFRKDPAKYTILKSLGADVFMRLFGDIVTWIFINKSGDLSEPKTYVPAFKKMLENLSGEAEDIDEPVSGSDFWRTGKIGAAGNYSSGKGKITLTKMMRKALNKK